MESGIAISSDVQKLAFAGMNDLYMYVLETESYVNRVGKHNSSVTKVSVIEVDLETLQKETIFEKITDRGQSLLGIEYEVGDQWEFLNYHQSIFVNDCSIFHRSFPNNRQGTNL